MAIICVVLLAIVIALFVHRRLYSPNKPQTKLNKHKSSNHSLIDRTKRLYSSDECISLDEEHQETTSEQNLIELNSFVEYENVVDEKEEDIEEEMTAFHSTANERDLCQRPPPEGISSSGQEKKRKATA